LVEYAIMLMLVGSVVIIILGVLGSAVGRTYEIVVGTMRGFGRDPRFLEAGQVQPGPESDCYGSLLLPYLVGLTALVSLVFWWKPRVPVVAMRT
jgi:hypothetical protein